MSDTVNLQLKILKSGPRKNFATFAGRNVQVIRNWIFRLTEITTLQVCITAHEITFKDITPRHYGPIDGWTDGRIEVPRSS